MFPEDRFLEILIIGALALIVIGPKDLPVLMRRIGRFVGKMRGMAAEFRASFDELARQSELDELRREVEALRHGQDLAAHADPMSEPHVRSTFEDIDQGLSSVQLTPPMSHQIETPAEPAQQAEAAPDPAPAAATPPAPAAKPRKPRAKAAKPVGEAS
jgi:sec-independent protein translocase protein TatB